MADGIAKATRVLQVMGEIHALTRLPRTGWIMAGVRDPESVSDHCFEAAILATLLAAQAELEVDIGRVVQMLLFHELAECRLTDLPRRSGPYIKDGKKAAEEQIASDVIASTAPEILRLLDEFHRRETPEARLAEAAEELQIIFCSLMYAKEGNGDMSEYPKDVAAYPNYDIELAAAVARLIGDKLDNYLARKPYWPLGYDRPIS